MGATSVRYAIGQLQDGKVTFEVVRQIANEPRGRCWNIDLLVGFCREAESYAKEQGATLGVDSWGVDHGFLDSSGNLVCGPVMYRDPSHTAKYQEFAVHRRKLFELTGIAHQPFNTLYQLAARKEEDPTLPSRSQWHLIPDLMKFYLTGVRSHEWTQASTTQLMGLDGHWCSEAFDLVGWPFPDRQPVPSGGTALSSNGVSIVSVASHDTGSAVLGVGALSQGDAYLNVGTWALLGVVLDKPLATPEAESGGWTNEWGFDGTIRFLKNIPGFYVINRLHDELGVRESVGQWLETRDKAYTKRFDPHDTSLYNPTDMPAACAALLGVAPSNSAQWAQAALGSLVDCIARNLPHLEKTIGWNVQRIRVVGGGSRSRVFCQALADACQKPVLAGPVEATVLGNLAAQFASVGDQCLDSVLTAVTESLHLDESQPTGE